MFGYVVLWIVAMTMLCVSWSDWRYIVPVRKTLRVLLFVGIQFLVINYIFRSSIQFTADTYLLQSCCKCVVVAIDRHETDEVASAINGYMTNSIPPGVNPSISVMLSALYDHLAQWDIRPGDFTRSTPLHTGHPGDALQQMRSDDSPTNPPGDGKR